MKKEEKFLLVENLTKKFSENNIFYLMDASGLSVAQINDFREKCFKKDVDIIIELIGGAEGISKKIVFSALKNKKHVITATKLY